MLSVILFSFKGVHVLSNTLSYMLEYQITLFILIFILLIYKFGSRLLYGQAEVRTFLNIKSYSVIKFIFSHFATTSELCQETNVLLIIV